METNQIVNMESAMFCRLCIKTCTDCESLYDANGCGTEVYKVTSKYFKSLLLKADANDERTGGTVICLECWTHISDFNSFEQTVLTAQAEHEQNLSQLAQFVKIEEEVMFEDVPHRSEEDNGAFEQDPVDVKVDEDGTREGENVEIKEDESGSSDDDKPLLSRIKCRRKKGTFSRLKLELAPRSPNCGDNIETAEGEMAKLDEHRIRSDKMRNKQNKTREFDDFIAKWKAELECDLCTDGHSKAITYSNFAALRSHFRAEHNTAKCYVLCCQRKYFHRFHLVEHMRLHLNPNVFKCPECGKCSTNSRNLAKHIRDIHRNNRNSERPFKCNICEKRFAKKGILQGHMETHVTGSKDHICKHCGKGFVLETRLKAHERYCIIKVCELCGKLIRGAYALKQHLMEHDGISKRKWPCNQCNVQLNSKYSLKRHKRTTHNDRSTAYVCGECGKVALSENALRSHKKYVHEAERKHKCSICNKAFKIALTLREHMTTHTGEDLYKCPHCPKTFKVNANMHHHRKRAHPQEWAAGHQHRNLTSKIDMSRISNEVVL